MERAYANHSKSDSQRVETSVSTEKIISSDQAFNCLQMLSSKKIILQV